MGVILREIWLCLLLAALIGWLVGWLLGRLGKSRPAVKSDGEPAGKLKEYEEERDQLRLEILSLKARLKVQETSGNVQGGKFANLSESQTNLPDAKAALLERDALRQELVALKEKMRGQETSTEGELRTAKARLAELESIVPSRDAMIIQLQHRINELHWFKGNLKTIVFPVDSPALTPQAMVTLDECIPLLKRLNSVTVEVSGHTDNIDTEDHNRWLSQQRADAVREYLVGKGVAPSQMVAHGYGSSRPVADNATEEGRQKNRRIEFEILKGA